MRKSQKLEMEKKKCIQVLPGTAVDPLSPASPLSPFGLPYSDPLVGQTQCLYLHPCLQQSVCNSHRPEWSWREGEIALSLASESRGHPVLGKR